MVQIGKRAWNPIAYKNYIKSEAWVERKRIYYLSHPHACEVCGHPDVDLHHLHYGDYGNEKDKNLAALCRVHHEEVHQRMPLKKNMYYHTRRLIDRMKGERQSSLAATARTPQHEQPRKLNLDVVLDRVAAPAWYLLSLVGIRRPK